MSGLAFAHGIRLPVDAVTQTFGLIGKRGAGKTYGAMKLAEGMLALGAQIIALDPVGKWWSLRVGADGKSPGFEIPVFGGHHGDLPLEPEAGALIADLVVDRSISGVLDVSLMRKGDRKRFVTAFAEQLYLRKKGEVSPTPLHFFLEEAQVFAPEGGGRGGDEARMLGAFEDIVKLGRNCGIGATLISQRPQSVNKNVLNQTECLIVLQVIGAHERKALELWMKEQGEDRRDVIGALPSLEQGEAYIWSPGWLRVFKRARIGKRTTFDASATPKLGAKIREPKKLAKVDLEALRERMAEVVQRAEETDPKALQKRIRELERELTRAQRDGAAASAEQLEQARSEGLRAARQELGQIVARMNGLQEQAVSALERAVRDLEKASDLMREPIDIDLQGADTGRNPRACGVATPPSGPPRPSGRLRSASTGDLPGPQQRILNALAWLESVGLPSPFTRVQVAFLAGYKVGAGAFNNPLGALRGAGLVEYPEKGKVAMTNDGRTVAVAPATPLTVDVLHAMVLDRLTSPQQRILQPLLEAYPVAVSRENLAMAAGYTAGAGAFNNPLGSLRSLGLIDYPRSGQVAARPVLFLAR